MTSWGCRGMRARAAAMLKSAFRRLAKKLHPDANKHDPKAAARFAELNAAYEVVGDEKKRKAFDRGEIDAEGKPRGFEGFGPRPGGFGGDSHFETYTWGPDGAHRSGGRGGFRGFGEFDDLLKEAFGGGGRAGRRGGFRFEPEGRGVPGRDVSAAVTITLPEAARHNAALTPAERQGSEVKIPAGLGDGKQIRLKGQGLPGPGGPGDVLITVSIAPHPSFAREGANLRLDLPITLYEAVLGAKVRVPTLDGALELAIPPGTSSGRTFRFKGKGFPAKEGAGDLFATIRIVLPEGSDADLDDLMRKWRDRKRYDPRKDTA